jgi:uncharacterized membrane protein
MSKSANLDRPGAGTQLRSARVSTRLYVLAALVSLVGLGDAIYLTVEHLTGNSVRCTIIAGCDVVLASAYSTIGGMPLAALGAAAYFAVFSLATLAAFGYSSLRTILSVLIAAMFLATLWLLFVQAFVLQHFCQYCLLSAAVTFGLTGIMFADWLNPRYR